MVQIYTCGHRKDEPTCMTPRDFHRCAQDMLTTLRYPSWLPIPSILEGEPGKVMYADRVFPIKLRTRGVRHCLMSIATAIMLIVAASIDNTAPLSILIRDVDDSPPPTSPSPRPEPMADPTDDDTTPPSSLIGDVHDSPPPTSPSPRPEPMADPTGDDARPSSLIEIRVDVVSIVESIEDDGDSSVPTLLPHPETTELPDHFPRHRDVDLAR